MEFDERELACRSVVIQSEPIGSWDKPYVHWQARLCKGCCERLVSIAEEMKTENTNPK